MRRFEPDVVSVVGPSGVQLLGLLYSGIQLYILLSLIFILSLFISRFVLTRRYYIDKLGNVNVNQTSICLNPH